MNIATSQRQIQLIMAPTAPRNKTQLQQFDNYHPTPIRKSTSQEYTNITQSSNTFQHFNIQPPQCCHIQSRKCLKCCPLSGSVEILFNAHKNTPKTHHVRTQKPTYPANTPHDILTQDNGLREGVGEYLAEYSPYSRNKPFTPISPVRTIFSPILYLRARPDLGLDPS